MTYTASGGALQLESAAFPGGVIRVTGSGSSSDAGSGGNSGSGSGGGSGSGSGSGSDGSGSSQEINYFLTDHLGSVRVIVDAAGDVKERNDYYAFGAKHIRSDYPQSGNRYDYNGKEDQTTGDLKFLDYGARMYDTRLGRWFNVDPLAEKLQHQSPYAYCNNDPVNYADPDGQFGIFGAIIGGVVGGIAEFGSQVISNLIQGNAAFYNLDWADIGISVGQGALIGGTAGIGLLASSGFEAAKASVDFKYLGDGDWKLESIGGLVGKQKDWSQIGRDFGAGLAGMGAGKLLSLGDVASGAVADMFVKNGIKSGSQFLTGMIVSELAGGLTDAAIRGSASGLFQRGANSLRPGGSLNPIVLPPVIIYGRQGEITPQGTFTPKGEKKIHDHLRNHIKR